MENSSHDELQRAKLAVLAAVMEGDAGLAFDVVNVLMTDGMAFDEVLFDVVAPLQNDVGRRWQQGDFAISEEHASTGAIETLVALLAGSLTQADAAEHVVVACAEGDMHSLPARMVAAYLTYSGYRVTFLGGSIPAADLGEFLGELKPVALVLSCAMATSLPGARNCIREAHGVGVPVIAGGRGFDEEARALRLGADAWAANPRDLDHLLRTWEPHPDRTEAIAHNGDAEAMALAAAAPEILLRAKDSAAQILGTTTTPARIGADMRVMLEATVAAVTVEEQRIVSEFADWHSELRAATHAGFEATPIILSSLHDAVAPHSPRAARYLDEALAALD